MIQLMTPYAANPLLRLVLFRWPARSLRVDVSRLRVPASKATPQRVGAIVQKTATGCVVEDPNAPALLIPSIETGYSMRVLLVEDNVKLASVTHDAMRSHGFTVDHVSNANDAEEAAATVDYDSIILDLGLPDRDGLTLIEPLRKTAPSTPLLILTARDSPSSIIDALDSGADDYLCKPFVMGVLISRLRAIMRRGQPRHGTILQHGDVTLTPASIQLPSAKRLLPSAVVSLPLCTSSYGGLTTYCRGPRSRRQSMASVTSSVPMLSRSCCIGCARSFMGLDRLCIYTICVASATCLWKGGREETAIDAPAATSPGDVDRRSCCDLRKRPVLVYPLPSHQ